MKTKLNLIAAILLFFSLFNAQTLMNETFTGTSLPTGWSISSTATIPDEKWTFYNDYDDVEVYESKTIPQNEWLYLPALNLQTYSSMFFNFSLWMYNKTSFRTNKSCRTAVVISTNNGATWTELWSTDFLNANEFLGEALYNRFWSINLSSYCGAGKPAVKMAFKYTSNATYTSTIPSFAALLRVNIASSPITSLSNLDKNVINWYPINNYSGNYDLYYGPLGTTTGKGGGILVSGLTGSSFTIPENYCQYTAFIRTNNGAPGEWVKLDFQNIVDNITAINTSNSSQLSWTGDSDLYDLEYGLGNFTVGNGTRISNISSTNYTLNSLLPNMSYKVYIKAKCNTGYWRSFTFKTLLLATDETEAVPLNVFPNPTTDFINFSEEVENIQILDNSARVVKTEKYSTKKIDISTLSKGNYIISGYVKGEKITKKIIKK